MGLMKKLTSAVVASSLVLGLVSSAFAAPSTEQINDAFARLSAYNVVQGKAMADGTVSPALGDTLTRAELVTILARAFGQEETAKLLKGATSFSDVAANEWYSGYVALIKNIAESKKTAVGYEDGTFRPNQNVKAIEALAFIMKLLGVQPGTGANWAADTIAAAKDAGIITAADAEAYLAAPTADATRGLAFGLADAIFRTYQVSAGKTVYTTYVDNVKPVLTINKPAEPTTTKTAYTVTGKAEGATAVYFGSEKITANADGSFTVDVSLAMGANTITFSAVDMAGNITEESFSLTRNAGAAEKVAASLSATSVMAGATADLTYTITDANGTVLTVNADDVSIVVAGEIGSFDKAAGKLTAATKVATGTITVSYGTLTPATINVSVVAGDLAKVVAAKTGVAPGASVKLTAEDAYGNTIEGVTFTESSADAFIEGSNFIATKAGQYTVTATKDGKTATGTVGVFGDVAKLHIDAPATVVANDATYVTVKVHAQDKDGNFVTNAAGVVELTTSLTPEDSLTADMADGVATFELKADETLADLAIWIDAELDIDAEVFATADAEGTGSIDGVAQVATSIKVEAPEYLPTDDTGDTAGKDVTVTVLDQLGESMLDGAWEFDVAVTGSASLKADSDDKAEALTLETDESFGIYPVFKGDTGTATITVSYPGLKSGTATVKAAMPLDAAKLTLTSDETAQTVSASATPIKFTVTSVDRNGVPADSTATVALTLTDVADSDILYSSLNNVLYTAVADSTVTVTLVGGTADFWLASKKADTFSVQVKDQATSGTLTASGTISVTYNADKAYYVGFSSKLINILRTPGKATFTAQLYDVYGNVVKTSGQKVTFADSADSYDGFTLNGAKDDAEVYTDANGKASVEVVVLDYISLADIEVTGTDLTAAANPTTTDVGADVYGETTVKTLAIVPTTISVDVVDAQASTANRVSSIQAGNDVYLKVTVKDNYGRPVTDVKSNEDYDFKITPSNSDLELGATETDGLWNATAAADGIYYSGAIPVEKAEALSLTVGLTNLAAKVEASRTISVKPAGVAAIEVVEADDNNAFTFSTDKTNELTLRLTDEYGNPVLSSQVTTAMKFKFVSTEVEVRNANTIEYVDGEMIIAKSRTTGKIYVVATADDANLVITGWYDTNDDNAVDIGETSFTFEVNPPLAP